MYILIKVFPDPTVTNEMQKAQKFNHSSRWGRRTTIYKVFPFKFPQLNSFCGRITNNSENNYFNIFIIGFFFLLYFILYS